MQKIGTFENGFDTVGRDFKYQRTQVRIQTNAIFIEVLKRLRLDDVKNKLLNIIFSEPFKIFSSSPSRSDPSIVLQILSVLLGKIFASQRPFEASGHMARGW